MKVDVSALLDELSELEQLKTEVVNAHNELGAELEPIFNTLKLSREWKKGNAADAYREAINEFYRSYGSEITELELMEFPIDRAISDIKSRINYELNRGPKF